MNKTIKHAIIMGSSNFSACLNLYLCTLVHLFEFFVNTCLHAKRLIMNLPERSLLSREISLRDTFKS